MEKSVVKLKNKKKIVVLIILIIILSPVIVGVIIVKHPDSPFQYNGTWVGKTNMGETCRIKVEFGSVTDVKLSWKNDQGSGSIETSWSRENTISWKGVFVLTRTSSFHSIYLSRVFINDTLYASFSISETNLFFQNQVFDTFNATRME
jgi:hypothetical protein